MRKLIVASILVLGIANVASAQSVTIDVDLIVTGSGTGYCNFYVPVADKFVSAIAGLTLEVFNGTTGAYETDMTLGAAAPSGLGFFGITAGSDGVIYGVDAGSGNLYRWADVTSPGTLAATGCGFTRTMAVIGTGVNTNVCLAGSANQGPIQIFTTANGTDFTMNVGVTAAAARAKSGVAMNAALNASWATGDVNNPIRKGSDPGSGWVVDPTFVDNMETGHCGPMGYDNTDDWVLSYNMDDSIVFVTDGTTGTKLAEAATQLNAFGTEGYSCGICLEGTQQFCFGARSATAHFVKASYGAAPVDDWYLY